MVSGTATLVVDLGNSETRVTTKYGVTGKGKPRERTVILSNRFGAMPEDKVQVYLNTEIYTEEDSSIFKYEGDTYCNGAICDTEFGATTYRPTALEKKYESFVTKLTLINAFKQGYETIGYFTDCELNSIDVSWNVTLLLPPEDVDTGAKKLAEMVRSISSIDFSMPNLKRDIVIDNVTIFPEGFCAYMGVLLESKSKVRSGYAYLADPDTYTLIIDIGAGTSDFVLAKGNQIINSSRFTKEIGGNNVHQRVRRFLKNKGIVLSDAIIRKGCETGEIKSGSKLYDIKEEIAQAKNDVSKQLVDAVQEFFEDNMLPIKMINNILVCGGGAESSDGIDPISDYIVDFMTRLSPDVKLVDLPVIDGAKVSSRMLNILGASILS